MREGGPKVFSTNKNYSEYLTNLKSEFIIIYFLRASVI